MSTNQPKVMTAPLAVIKFNGIAIGRMRDITLTESIARGSVRGIGSLTVQEVPAIAYDCTLNCGLYLIDFSKAMNFINNFDSVKGAPILQRRVKSADEFVDTVLLQEDGVTVDVMRKVTSSTDPTTGIITSALQIFASIKGAFLTRESMNISEAQIGGRNADFIYTTPVIYST